MGVKWTDPDTGQEHDLGPLPTAEDLGIPQVEERKRKAAARLAYLEASCPDDIRAAGWVVGHHWDNYDHTGLIYWSFDKWSPDGKSIVEDVDAIGATDAGALNEIRKQIGIPTILTILTIPTIPTALTE